MFLNLFLFVLKIYFVKIWQEIFFEFFLLLDFDFLNLKHFSIIWVFWIEFFFYIDYSLFTKYFEILKFYFIDTVPWSLSLNIYLEWTLPIRLETYINILIKKLICRLFELHSLKPIHILIHFFQIILMCNPNIFSA